MTSGAMQSQHFASTQSSRIPKAAYLTSNYHSVPNQSFVKDSVMSYSDEQQYVLGDYPKPARTNLHLSEAMQDDH